MNTKGAHKKNRHIDKYESPSIDSTRVVSNDSFHIPISSLKMNITVAVIILLILVAGGYEVYSRNLFIFQKLNRQPNPNSYLVCDKGTCVISPLFLNIKK